MNFGKNIEPAPRGMIGPRISRASKNLRCRFNKVVNDEGLFSGQHHIILLLKHFEGLTISQVAEYLKITPATASVSIKRMEKAGFVEKRFDEKDARITRLYLSEKGKAATEHIRVRMDAQEALMTRGLSEEEIMLLSDLLDRVLENVEKECEHCG